MTSRKLSQLDTLDDLQDGDRIYVVRASLDEDERSQAIEVEDAKAYFATDLTDLTARVAALEAGVPPTPHSMTRYAALRDDGAMPSDFDAADFLAVAATSSETHDITNPTSDDDKVVGVAVPTSEGTLSAVAGLDSAGDVNQFQLMIRDDFLPASGDADVTLEIDGADHYVYCTSSTVRAIFLGLTGYRLTQTAE